MAPPRQNHAWGGIVNRSFIVWKLVTRLDGTTVVAVCRVPAGAKNETAGTADTQWHRSDQLEILEVGQWVEEPQTARFVPDAQADEYYTLVGIPGQVSYKPGHLAAHVDGLWSYATPWQTYWPYSPRKAEIRTLIAEPYGVFTWVDE